MGKCRATKHMSTCINSMALRVDAYRKNHNIFLDKFDPGKCHFTNTKLHL